MASLAHCLPEAQDKIWLGPGEEKICQTRM